MSNKKMSKDVEDMILNVIDKIVTSSGYPVVSMALKAAGISRENIRHIEDKGLVESIELKDRNSQNKAAGTIVKAYYTHRVYPKVLIERDKHLKEEQEKRLLDNIGKALKEETEKKVAKPHEHHKGASAE